MRYCLFSDILKPAEGSTSYLSVSVLCFDMFTIEYAMWYIFRQLESSADTTSHLLVFLLCSFMCTIDYAMWYIFRQLRSQQRIQLHICLFLSFVFTCVLKIMWDLLVYNDRIHNPWQHTFMVKFEVSFSTSKHSRATIEPPAKRNLNGVSLVG